jgi:cell division protein FtsQ
MKLTDRQRQIIKIFGQSFLTITIIAAFTLLIYASSTWCCYIELFDVAKINISGNTILTDREIIQTAGMQTDTNIQAIDLRAIQANLEINPYIKAATISRNFPNRINIRISERQPICYINHRNLYLLDCEGIVLPLPQAPLGTNLPVISGFDGDSLDYYPGYYVPNATVRDIVNIIYATMHQTPLLYSEISEIHHWKDGSWILYTAESGTPIYLGTKDLSEQLNILAHFQNRLNGKRNLSDYQYLDLRWNKQIVAKEQHS